MKKSGVMALFVSNGKALLVRRKANEQKYPDRWILPSGHIEDGETSEDALVREMKEELGVTPVKYRLILSIRHTDGGEHYHYLFHVNEWRGEVRNNSEIADFGWFSLEEVKKKDMPRAEEYIHKIKEIMK